MFRNRLLDQGYKKIRLIRSLKKFIFRYQNLVEIYSVKMYKVKEAKKNIYFTEYGTALTTVLATLLLYLNIVIVTAGTFEP